MIRNGVLIVVSILIIGCQNNESKKPDSLTQTAENTVNVTTQDSILKSNPTIIDSGYTVLNKIKKEVKFGNAKAKFKLGFADFHPNTSPNSYANYFFNENGTVTELSLDEGFIDIKDKNGEIKYLRVFPDKHSIISLLKKNLKVGDRINTICTPQGARLVEIVELKVY